ncbi:glycosyltransferase family 4 protein [Pleomorphomonas koreensis]|uniref:glycosyltransferase family 4 protein n=1 Tax=Pleomorphomonas koreensis TaxID=257440 RepID=UPI0004097488|nr:glycosyltransferase family 4 protein [Pleomorphomonas koreensis]
MAHRITILHTIDPRGGKVGGIETHVRLMLSRHPADVSVLLVGMDERGDLEIGKPVPVEFDGRRVDFLPVVHIPGDTIHAAAKTVLQSVTLRFTLGVIRHLLTIRRLAAGDTASTEIERFELAIPARLIGHPVVQLVHGEGSKGDKMDTILARYWWLYRLNEAIALNLATRVVGVNPNIIARYEREMPRIARKSEFMTVSVDTERFPAAPFPATDVFRVVFAGRLDAFKDPPLMFETLRRLHGKLGGKLEFHYVGTSDPYRDKEFAGVEAFTIRHGFQTGDGVSAIMRDCHAGILTSYFEGMPCYLLEALSSGRPVGAIRLPQYDPLIESGVSGFLVERPEDREAAAEQMAEGFARLAADIFAGKLDPEAIRAKVTPYSVAVQMPKLFERHVALGRTGTAARQPGPASPANSRSH